MGAGVQYLSNYHHYFSIKGLSKVTGSVRQYSQLVCVFVVYLTTLFQYLRLYSVDFYSILIRLPSSSEAGETRVRNMAKFCRRVPIVLVGFFYMP
jgi:hypothetical protein